eukprot:gene28253-34118_t
MSAMNVLTFEQFESGLEFLVEIWDILRKEASLSAKLLDAKNVNTEEYTRHMVINAQYSQIKSAPTRGLADDTFFSYDEESLSLDSQAVVHSADGTVHLELHILLHPTYRIPCPYVKAWRENGVMVTEIELARLLSMRGNVSPFDPSGTNHSATEKDYRSYNFGSFVLDCHPILDTPVYTFHICDLSNRLQPLVESYVSSHATSELNGQISGRIYMLLWLTYVGPYIGIAIPPSLFVKLQSVV